MKYRLIFRGEITADANIEEVKKALAILLKADAPRINNLFSGNPMIIKKDADLKTCQKIKAAFEHAGAVSVVEPQRSATVTQTQTKPSKGPLLQPPPLPDRKKTETPEIKKNERSRRGDEKFCVSCGEVIKLNSLTCPYCGKKQKEEGVGCLPKAAIAAGVGIFAMAIRRYPQSG